MEFEKAYLKVGDKEQRENFSAQKLQEEVVRIAKMGAKRYHG